MNLDSGRKIDVLECGPMSPTEKASAAIDHLFCPRCGYDVSYIPSTRCPECGMPIDLAALATLPAPWIHRQPMGSVRAYFRSVLVITLWPWRLGRYNQWPVALADSVRFRRLTVVIACLPLWLAGVVMCGESGDLREIVASNVASVMATAIAWLLAGVLTWAFFQVCSTAAHRLIPVSIRTSPEGERGKALLNYASAPLAWCCVVVLFFVVRGMASATIPSDSPLAALPLVCGGLGSVVAIVLLIAFLIGNVSVSRQFADSVKRIAFRHVVFIVMRIVVTACLCVAIFVVGIVASWFAIAYFVV